MPAVPGPVVLRGGARAGRGDRAEVQVRGKPEGGVIGEVVVPVLVCVDVPRQPCREPLAPLALAVGRQSLGDGHDGGARGHLVGPQTAGQSNQKRPV